uniref:Uncharacterized protein n=1 Tax=viral metagenome TaxID=1070528 RepID=A0A6C0EKW0_9ZZZZ
MRATLFLLSLASLASPSVSLIIEPNTIYTLDLPAHYNSSINIKLEIQDNNMWMTHNENGHYYLSIIVDMVDNQFKWHVPSSLTTYWKNSTRLKISDMKEPASTEYINVKFEGFDISTISDSFNLKSQYIYWETNSLNNYTLKLVNKTIVYLDNFKRSYLWTVPNTLEAADYYISINGKYLSNTFNINRIYNATPILNNYSLYTIIHTNTNNRCKHFYITILLIIVLCLIVIYTLYTKNNKIEPSNYDSNLRLKDVDYGDSQSSKSF